MKLNRHSFLNFQQLHILNLPQLLPHINLRLGTFLFMRHLPHNLLLLALPLLLQKHANIHLQQYNCTSRLPHTYSLTQLLLLHLSPNNLLLCPVIITIQQP